MARHSKPSDINAAEKAKLALTLRKQGYSLEDIATQCGFADRSGAFRAIKRELDRIPAPDVADLRKVETERMDEMLKACYSQAQGGSLWAVDRVVAISKRRSELTGMDARADEHLTQQNYTKRIVLTHRPGEDDGGN